MAGTPSFVRVAVDGVGKKILNLLHAAYLAGDDAYQQLTGIADPTDPSVVGAVKTSLPADNEAGQVTREAPDNYDSGITALTNAYVAPTVLTVRVTGIWLCNLTASVQPVFVTNTGGNLYLNGYPLQANQSIFLPMGGVKLVGIKWKATNGASVDAQIFGRT